MARHLKLQQQLAFNPRCSWILKNGPAMERYFSEVQALKASCLTTKTPSHAFQWLTECKLQVKNTFMTLKSYIQATKCQMQDVKSPSFFLTECPGDTFFRGWWWSCSKGADGGRKQAKDKQTNCTPLSILICHELRTPCFISMSWISLGQKKTLRVENERASLATHQPINVWLLIGYIISLILTSWWLMCDAARFCKTSWLWVSYQFSLPVFCMRPSLETTSADTYPPSEWIKNIFHHVILGSFPYTSCSSISVFYHHLDWVWTCVSLPGHLWGVESLVRGARPCPWKLPMKVVWLISFASMLARPASRKAAGCWQIFGGRWRGISWFFFHNGWQLFPSSGEE